MSTLYPGPLCSPEAFYSSSTPAASSVERQRAGTFQQHQLQPSAFDRGQHADLLGTRFPGPGSLFGAGQSGKQVRGLPRHVLPQSMEGTGGQSSNAGAPIPNSEPSRTEAYGTSVIRCLHFCREEWAPTALIEAHVF